MHEMREWLTDMDSPVAPAADWPFFRALREQPLGAFGNPRVICESLQYARLQPGHALMRRAAALGKKRSSVRSMRIDDLTSKVFDESIF
jgi:hypothetical protein